jgi:hypothetical protein
MRGASLIMLQQIADAYGVSPERIKKRKTTRRAAAEEAQPASNAA